MRTLIEALNRIVSWLRHTLGFRIPARGPLVKLNLGCGLAVHPGWVNVHGSLNTVVASLPAVFQSLAYRVSGASSYYSFDEYRRILCENVFFHADLSYGIPAPDGSVDFIYSSHLLEHLYPAEARQLLVECHRVLKPGGIVRICVPDLEYAFGMYQSGRKQECLDTYFFVEDRGSVYARHKYMYDFELLAELLGCVGFQSIRRCRFHEGHVPEADRLDNRPEETLFVEATK